MEYQTVKGWSVLNICSSTGKILRKKKGSSHQIMGTGSGGLHQKAAPSPAVRFLPVSVQTSTLSALSVPQTAEVWDPLPDLPIGFPGEFC